jgi:N-acetylglucosaminyl-diphospho-decaprenol L-rhamnosyltransferase
VSTLNIPVLSIVIVAYKSCNEIAECLESIRFANSEVDVVVIDNSAGDGTAELVRSRFTWVKYVPAATNLGFGRANNDGYAMTDPQSECVLFLNPDTICNESALRHCMRRLLEDRAVGLITPKLVLRDGSMDLACRRSIPTLWDGFCRAVGLAAAFPRSARFCGYNLTHLPENGTYDVGAINGAFMMGRREVFERIVLQPENKERVALSENRSTWAAGPEAKTDQLLSVASSKKPLRVFDDSFFMYGDDLDLCIRVRKAGYRIVYDGAVEITHLKGLSVAKDRAAMSRAIFDANRDVYLKHFNPSQSVWVRWTYRAAFELWKRLARLRAAIRGHQDVRPL